MKIFFECGVFSMHGNLLRICVFEYSKLLYLKLRAYKCIQAKQCLLMLYKGWLVHYSNNYLPMTGIKNTIIQNNQESAKHFYPLSILFTEIMNVICFYRNTKSLKDSLL